MSKVHGVHGICHVPVISRNKIRKIASLVFCARSLIKKLLQVPEISKFSRNWADFNITHNESINEEKERDGFDPRHIRRRQLTLVDFRQISSSLVNIREISSALGKSR